MAEGRTFLLEIGCEEIPAPMIPKALDDLTAGLLAALGPLAAGASSPRDLGGPRRLVALVTGLKDREVDREEIVTGPPKSAAFDAQGQPTRAALGFAKGQGVEVADLKFLSTPKGEVVSATRKIKGRSAAEVLAFSIPSVLGAMRFGKMMRWGGGGHVFVRPVKWILALLDADVVPFEFVGVRSGRTTRGHRFLGAGPHPIQSPAEYESVLREKGRLVIRIEERRRTLLDLATKGAAAAGGRLRPDPDLLEELTFLTEHPAVARGSFPEEFLALPEPVLLTTMRHHQKYLTVEGSDGRLKNAFIAALTTDNDAGGLIRRGNEWVLKARLADAKFFFEEDRKKRLEERIPDLARVTFHGKLGTYADKVERMKSVLRYVAAALDLTQREFADTDQALRLSKTDLTTNLVGEFPELQGVVGGVYARLQGESEGCASAIEEHYRPTSMDGLVATTRPGIALAVLDKLDTLSACFRASLVPKGSTDPYGLRRAGHGLLRTLIENNVRLIRSDESGPLHLQGLANQAWVHTRGLMLDIGKEWELDHASWTQRPSENTRKKLREQVPEGQRREALYDFFKQRLQHLMETSGIRVDVARAVLVVGWTDPLLVWRRANALNELRGHGDFLALAAVAKRVRNILSQAQAEEMELPNSPGELIEFVRATHQDELLMEIARAENLSEASVIREEYQSAFSAIASLRPAVDRFFENVLVMDPDESKRRKNLSLMKRLNRVLSSQADFAEIVVEGETQAQSISSRGSGG